MWTVILRGYPGNVGIVRSDLVYVHDGRGSRWSDVVRKANPADINLAGGLAGGVSGVHAEGIGVSGKKSRKGVAGGRPRKNDSRADIVSAPKVVVEVAGPGRSRIPGERDCISRCCCHSKVRGRRWPACQGGRRKLDHCERQNYCSEMSYQR